MDKTKYTKTIKIKEKVFILDDIQRLAKILADEYHEGDYELTYKIAFTDDVSLESASIEVFKNDYFKRKRVSDIWMTYSNHDFKKKIEIRISEVKIQSKYNRIEIISDDEAWYNSMIGRFNEVTLDIQEQPKIYTLYNNKYSLVVLHSILGASIMFTLISFADEKLRSIPYLCFASCMFCALLFIGILLLNCLNNVEFNFGPEHKNKEKKKRIFIGGIFTVILIPFIFLLIDKLIG